MKKLENTTVGHGYELKIGDKTYWFVAVMGTSVMSIYIHIASALGSKINILLGSVGGLKPGMSSGDLIIPTSVIGNDNARMYDRDNKENINIPDDKLLAKLRKSLGKTDIKVWEGQTTTCEIMLAETEQDVADWSKAGMLGVEMEAALFFAAAKYFKIPAISLLFVADNLIENESFLGEEYQQSKAKRELTKQLQYQIGVDLLIQ